MTKYYLSGIFSPILGRSSFLIPYFNLVGSNEVFVQDLDDQYQILRFVRANPASFRDTFFKPPIVEKKVGDDGLLAYRINGDRPQIGGANDLKNQLKNEITDGASCAFFSAEAYTFLGDKDKAIKAINHASQLFRNEDIGKIWADVEEEVTTILLGNENKHINSAPIHEDEYEIRIKKAIKNLIESDESPVWTRSWRKAWAEFFHDERIQNIGYWWIKKLHSEDGRIATVLSQILGAKSANDTTVSFSIDWARSMVHSSRWYEVWHPLLRHYQIPSNDKAALLHAGWNYLNYESMKETSRRAYRWSRVWQLIYKNMGYLEKFSVDYAHSFIFGKKDLEKMTLMVFEDFKDNGIFMSNVVTRVLRSEDVDDYTMTELLERIHEWISQKDKFDYSLIELYKALPHTAAFFTLAEMSVKWLSETDPSTRLWSKVWIETMARRPNHNFLFDLGINWLNKCETDHTDYPNVLLELLRYRGAEGHIARLAERWIEKQPALSQKGREILFYLGDYKYYRS